MSRKLPQRVTEQRSHVVASIIDAIEHNDLTWLQEWAAGSAPQNLVSGNAYRGVNRINLTIASRLRGISDPRFITYKQAKERGWQVRRGAKSMPVEKWKSYRIPSLDDSQDDRIAISCVGYYSVFSIEDVDGETIPEYKPPFRELDDNSVTRVADRLIASSRCPVVEVPEGVARYSVARDDIRIPDRRLFLGDDETRSQNFVRTLLHEMSHSTMKPLDRPHDDYAREELVAELSAVFAVSDLHIGSVTYDTSDPHFVQHAAYIQSWSSRLRDKPDALFTAAALADRAADYIVRRYNELEV